MIWLAAGPPSSFKRVISHEPSSGNPRPSKTAEDRGSLIRYDGRKGWPASRHLDFVLPGKHGDRRNEFTYALRRTGGEDTPSISAKRLIASRMT